MNSTPLHDFVIGPLALACAFAVFVAAALEAPDLAVPVHAAASLAAAP
jgi:hypothetical protein